MNDQTAIKILYTLHPFKHNMTAVAKRFSNSLREQTTFEGRWWEYKFMFDWSYLIEMELAYQIKVDLYEH